MEILSGTTLIVLLVVAAAAAGLLAGKLQLSKKMPMLDDILMFAQVAIQAVEKLSDNGAYDGLSAEERHAKKKADALKFIESALSHEFNITMTPVLRYLADMAIEAVLKMVD